MAESMSHARFLLSVSQITVPNVHLTYTDNVWQIGCHIYGESLEGHPLGASPWFLACISEHGPNLAGYSWSSVNGRYTPRTSGLAPNMDSGRPHRRPCSHRSYRIAHHIRRK